MLFVSADWIVRVLGSSGPVDIPSNRLSVLNISMSGLLTDASITSPVILNHGCPITSKI